MREVFDGLLSHASDPEVLERDAGVILHNVVDRANTQVAQLANARPELRGMGATVLVPLVVANRLYWISVGDSPLYLLRGRRLSRLNQIHSMASLMDQQVADGMISPQEAAQHPDRDCLTSVLVGRRIPQIDCCDCPIDLEDGDIVIAASDGLQFIEETRIAQLVYDGRHRTSAEIGSRLLEEVRYVDDPEQDNVSLCVLKICRQDRVQDRAIHPPVVPRPVANPRVIYSIVRLNTRRAGHSVSYRLSSVRKG